MRIRCYDSSLWSRNGGVFTALLVRASQFTLGLKYRLHLVPEWSAPFSNIIKRLSSEGRAPCLDIKLTYFLSKASRLFQPLPNVGGLGINGYWQTALHAAQTISSSLYATSRGLFLPSQPASAENMAEPKAEWNKMPARLFCTLSVCNVLWQQRVPAEPRRQVRGLLRRVGHLTGVGLLAPANGEHLWLQQQQLWVFIKPVYRGRPMFGFANVGVSKTGEYISDLEWCVWSGKTSVSSGVFVLAPLLFWFWNEPAPWTLVQKSGVERPRTAFL